MLRRRAASDIAHDLATPATVLESQLQAMIDGVVPDRPAGTSRPRARPPSALGERRGRHRRPRPRRGGPAPGPAGARSTWPTRCPRDRAGPRRACAASGRSGSRWRSPAARSPGRRPRPPRAGAPQRHRPTRSATARSAAASRCRPWRRAAQGAPAAMPATSRSASPTRVRASRRTTSPTSSSASTGPTPSRADGSRDRPARPACGLGLTIARELLAANGGRIAVERTGPDGTTFLIDIPARLSRPSALRARRASGRSARGPAARAPRSAAAAPAR